MTSRTSWTRTDAAPSTVRSPLRPSTSAAAQFGHDHRRRRRGLFARTTFVAAFISSSAQAAERSLMTSGALAASSAVSTGWRDRSSDWRSTVLRAQYFVDRLHDRVHARARTRGLRSSQDGGGEMDAAAAASVDGGALGTRGTRRSKADRSSTGISRLAVDFRWYRQRPGRHHLGGAELKDVRRPCDMDTPGARRVVAAAQRQFPASSRAHAVRRRMHRVEKWVSSPRGVLRGNGRDIHYIDADVAGIAEVHKRGQGAPGRRSSPPSARHRQRLSTTASHPEWSWTPGVKDAATSRGLHGHHKE